jgi:hypothetical protein
MTRVVGLPADTGPAGTSCMQCASKLRNRILIDKMAAFIEKISTGQAIPQIFAPAFELKTGLSLYMGTSQVICKKSI